MTNEYALFDVSDHLDNEEVIAEYLTAAAEDENPDLLLIAIANVAKARGMTHVAKAAGLSRESLYKTLAPGAHPRFETIRAVLRALNVSVIVKAPGRPALTKLAKPPRKTNQPKLSAYAAEKAAKKARAKKAAAKPATPARKRA
jgi:probable addiction module antidote protein